MAVTFYPDNKRQEHCRARAVERAAGRDWDRAVIIVDTRHDYAEPRLRVMARLNGVLHAAVVTPRGGDLRVISFRRANGREVKLYAKKGKG